MFTSDENDVEDDMLFEMFLWGEAREDEGPDENFEGPDWSDFMGDFGEIPDYEGFLILEES